MSRPIVKLAENEYLEWSSIVDAPTSYIVDREKMKKYLMSKYNETEEKVESRLKRADLYGTSYLHIHYESVEEFIAANRAGEKEACLTLEEIREKYKEKS